MKPLGTGALKLLRKLAIDPSLSQADLAKELDVTRSAVNQIWQRLRKERNLSVRSSFDYGQLGIGLLFGWASDREGSDILPKFSRWLTSSPLTVVVMRSAMSSMMDTRIYFEALLPQGQRGVWFLDQLERFKKNPYNLSLVYGFASHIANHLNLGLFDGHGWDMIDGFRFGATIDSAKGYADVLPDVRTSRQSDPVKVSLDDVIVASIIERNFHATSRQLKGNLSELGKPKMSERTLRRRLSGVRKKRIVPYVQIENIGLSQRIAVSLQEAKELGDSSLSRLLRVQATTLPKARVVHNGNLTSMILDLPESVSWFAISQVLSESAGAASTICTFIADDSQIWNGLDSLFQVLVEHTGEDSPPSRL